VQANASKLRGPVYISVGAAVLETLREMGGEARVDALLREIARRYGRGPRRVVMRLYPRPGGGYWSPEAEEALRELEAIGFIERRDGTVKLKRR